MMLLIRRVAAEDLGFILQQVNQAVSEIMWMPRNRTFESSFM